MSEREKREFQAGEKVAQRHADLFYARQGYVIASRDGCREWDLQIQLRGRLWSVEEKFRVGLHFEDLLVEILQDMRTGALGWAYETRCDLLHYFLCDRDWRPALLHQVDWPRFREWLHEYVSESRQLQWVKSTRGWGTTINIAVPFSVIPLGIVMRHELREAA